MFILILTLLLVIAILIGVVYFFYALPKALVFQRLGSSFPW